MFPCLTDLVALGHFQTSANVIHEYVNFLRGAMIDIDR